MSSLLPLTCVLAALSLCQAAPSPQQQVVFDSANSENIVKLFNPLHRQYIELTFSPLPLPSLAPLEFRAQTSSQKLD